MGGVSLCPWLCPRSPKESQTGGEDAHKSPPPPHSSCVTSLCPSEVASILQSDTPSNCAGGLHTEHMSTVGTATKTSDGAAETDGDDHHDDHHDEPDEDHHHLSAGAIAGIAVGAFVGGVAIIGGLIWFIVKKRRGKKAQYDAVNQTTTAAAVAHPPPAPPTPGMSPGPPVYAQAHHSGYGYPSQTPASGAAYGGWEQKSVASPPPQSAVVDQGVAQPGQVYEISGEEPQNGPVFEISGEGRK